MPKLGSRLLHTPRWLKSYQDRVLGDIYERVKSVVLYERDYPFEELRNDLEKEFCLAPIVLGEVKSVAVFVDPVQVRSADGLVMAYVAEARVAYRGTHLLWQARSNLPFAFPYRGRPAEASVGWRSIVPSKDLTEFEAEVQQVAGETGAALNDYAPIVRSHDASIRAKIDLVLRTF